MLFLSAIILGMSTSLAYAKTPSASVNSSSLIFKKAISLDNKNKNTNFADYKVVSLEKVSGISDKSAGIKMSAQSLNSNNVKGFQKTEIDGSNYAVVTIIPYKINQDGELENSFDFVNRTASSNSLITPQNTITVPSSLVDVTVTTTTYYAQYFSAYNIKNFYRHAGDDAYWSSENSSINMDEMKVNYDSCGDLYRYPDCLNQSLSSTFIQSNYYILSPIDEYNPSAGTLYTSYTNVMPISEVLLFTDYMNHGGYIYINVTYDINGSQKNCDTGYYVYQK